MNDVYIIFLKFLLPKSMFYVYFNNLLHWI